MKNPLVVEKSCNFTNSFQTGIKKSILSDMNGFQERLLALISEFERAGRVICESEEVSRLDLDTLRRKMRRMYDFIISADIEPVAEKTERIAQSAPEIEQVEALVQPLEATLVGEAENKTPIYSDKTPFHLGETAFCFCQSQFADFLLIRYALRMKRTRIAMLSAINQTS